MSKKRSKLLLLPVCFLILGGCFPIELDVNDKGQILFYRQEGFFLFDPRADKVIPVAGPGAGQPEFARFSPNGKDVLLVTSGRFDIAPLKMGGKIRTVFRAHQAAYARFSPDGTQLAVVRVTSKNLPQLDNQERIRQNTTALHLVEVADATNEVIAEHLGGVFCWFQDGRRLLVFRIRGQDNRGLVGNIAIFDRDTREFKLLTNVVCPPYMMLDLSPDNQTVLFTAFAAGADADLLGLGRFPPLRLFEWSAKTQSVRRVNVPNGEAIFARYSPSGNKVLVASPSQDFDIPGHNLYVADAQWKKFTLVAANVAEGSHSPLGGKPVPGWINDEEIYYFLERSTYGTYHKSLALATRKADGTDKRVVQALLDKAAYEANLPDVAPPDERQERVKRYRPVYQGPIVTYTLFFYFIAASFALLGLLLLIVIVLGIRSMQTSKKEQMHEDSDEEDDEDEEDYDDEDEEDYDDEDEEDYDEEDYDER